MKKIFLLFVISFLFGKNSEAQNLVPNPSFEETDTCPDFPGQVWRAQGWYISENSPDYYNACCNSQLPNAGVPNNQFGFRYAATGNAYCGIWAYQKYPLPGYDEKFGCQLSSPLTVGTKYFVSIKMSSVSINQDQTVNGSNNKNGILFSTIKYDLNNLPPTNNYCQFYSDSFVTDTLGWTPIRGEFIADSAYSFLTIGNFFDHNHIDTVRYWFFNGGSQLLAYYYIDDICVSPDSLGCDLNPEGIYSLPEKNYITIYPNPAIEQLIIDNGQLKINEIEITDAVGRIQSSKYKIQRPVTQIDIHTLASGIYFIKVYFGDGGMEVRKFVKQ